ncbi:hypothetical protein KCP78_19255 [Salmonella enterica subsp. enterica]|nr:hypothetical protein KCP78_19255 [Salmonella enterica subsp. enterica]
MLKPEISAHERDERLLFRGLSFTVVAGVGAGHRRRGGGKTLPAAPADRAGALDGGGVGRAPMRDGLSQPAVGLGLWPGMKRQAARNTRFYPGVADASARTVWRVCEGCDCPGISAGGRWR